MKLTDPVGSDRWIHIYDGENQWAEHHFQDRLTVYLIRLHSFSNSDRPFDSGYFLMGSVLLTGEDYPTTLRTLLSIYSMSAQCTPDGAMLSGELNDEGLRKYVNSKQHVQDPESMINRFANEFPFGTIMLKTDPLSVQG